MRKYSETDILEVDTDSSESRLGSDSEPVPSVVASGEESLAAGVEAPEVDGDSVGVAGSEEIGTPRISASAAGDWEASRLEWRWR